MTVATIGLLNYTLEETHKWLTQLVGGNAFRSEEQAYSGLRAVLHPLRDRPAVEEAVHLSAQLPMLVRGFDFEGWRPSVAPNGESTKEEFYASVEESLRDAKFTIDSVAATREVFQLLEDRLSEGQIWHVVSQLPAEIQALW